MFEGKLGNLLLDYEAAERKLGLLTSSLETLEQQREVIRIAYRVNCEHIARYIVSGKPYCHQIIVGDWKFLGYRTNRYCWNLARRVETKIKELEFEELL